MTPETDQRPHIVKTRHFLTVYPHPLKNNEWLVKWPIVHRNGKTYNPDFWCEHSQCFIELATSSGNVHTERDKWRDAIRRGYPLRVYWWQGQEITAAILHQQSLCLVRTASGDGKKDYRWKTNAGDFERDGKKFRWIRRRKHITKSMTPEQVEKWRKAPPLLRCFPI